MLNKFMERLNSAFLSLGRSMAKVGFSPTAWRFVGLTFALLSGITYAYVASAGQLLGGLLIIGSGFFDLVDGAVAKVTNKISKRGAFLDSTLDRVGEVAIYTGILLSGFSRPLWVLLALSFSLLVSYTRARAEALGTSLSGIGIGERSERLLVLAILSIVGLVDYGVILVAAIAGFTFLERTYRASVSLGERLTPRDQGRP
jgi:archaetidylinositol phosphate synthase